MPASWPPGEYDRDAQEFFLERLQSSGGAGTGWYGWYAICGDDSWRSGFSRSQQASSSLVGAGGFFGPPDDTGVVEVGFSLWPECTGQGFATEMVTALVSHVRSQPRVSASSRTRLARTLPRSPCYAARDLVPQQSRRRGIWTGSSLYPRRATDRTRLDVTARADTRYDRRLVKDKPAAAQFNAFLARYSPEVRTLAKAVLAGMRTRLPGAVEIVYDNYNALVVGFGPSERATEAIFSIALYPRWVTLFFLQGGPQLPDPHNLLRGTGSMVRNVQLKSAGDIDHPAVKALMKEALSGAVNRIDRHVEGRMVIKSVSENQRSRRPA